MRDIGYRRAEVEVLQGVSLNGENLIITFNVIEGPLTRIAGVEVRGNKIYTEERLRNRAADRNWRALLTLAGKSRQRASARALCARRLRKCPDRFFRRGASQERRGRTSKTDLYVTVDLIASIARASAQRRRKGFY